LPPFPGWESASECRDAQASAKAKVADPKRSLGPIKGGAVRLAPAGPTLLVGEGIETTLAAMIGSDLPGWAALSTGGLRGLVLPDLVQTVIIAADHDPPGIATAEAAATRWHAEGRRVRIALPPESKTDFNDLVRAELASGAADA
jgi:hypothetical protein